MNRVIIPTSRPELVLKQFIVEDAPEIFRLVEANKEHLAQHGEVTPKKYQSVEDVVRSIEFPTNLNRLRMGIWNTHTFVGSANITFLPYGFAEVGYYLGKEHLKRGYATLSVVALTNYAFNQRGCENVFAHAHKQNIPSIRVLERAGYALSEDQNPHKISPNNLFSDQLLYVKQREGTKK